MYQRYYRQRKFGRIFSVFLVIGSGLSHYIREGKSILKNLASLENVLKYQEYFPNNIKDLIDDFNKNGNNFLIKEKFEDFDLLNNKKEKNEKFKNDLYLYNQNLRTININFNKNYNSFNSFEINQNRQYNLNNNKTFTKDIKKISTNYINDNIREHTIKNDIILEINEEDRKIIETYLILKDFEKKIL